MAAYALCRPPQRKVCLGYSSGGVEHFEQNGTIDCRIPLLSQFRTRQDRFPGIEGNCVIGCGYVKHDPIYCVIGFGCPAMNNDIRELWKGRARLSLGG
jgi:hypothetical protein